MADSQGSRDGDFSPGFSSVQQKSSNPESSCVSVKSDRSMELPPVFKSEDTRPDLRLRKCGVTDEGCAALASALRSNPSHLRELNLSENNLGDSGVKMVSAVLENPHCKLEKLWLWQCGVTDEGCAALASALRSNPSSHLRELNLSGNNLGVSGVKIVSAVLENPHCKLEKLGLSYCGVTDEGCAALASALRSNPSSHLRLLNLFGNNLTHSGLKLLEDLKDDPHYKLETLYVSDDSLIF